MKALPLLLLAMSLPLFAQNPICNSSTNHDSNGNVCTNFTTASYYNPNRRPIQFDMDTQDGQAVNTDNAHSIVLDYPDYPYNVQIGIPTDPLITLGFIPSYGSRRQLFMPTIRPRSSVVRMGSRHTESCINSLAG